MSEQVSPDNNQQAAASTAQVDTSTAPIQDTATNTDPGQQAAAPAYTPNYKYKVKDQEHEFDEWLRPVIKDPEVEKKAREMYERAMGLDEVKASRDNFKTKYEDVNTRYSSVENSLRTVAGYANKGDYDRFFQALQIPEEKILQWTINKLKYKELPPEQRAQIDRQRSLEMEQEQFEYQRQLHEQQLADLGRQQLEFELSKPDVAQIAKDFDTRVGRQGAFQNEVINRGAFYELAQQGTKPAFALVQEVMQMYNLGSQNPASTQNPAQSQSGQAQPKNQQKPTIPVFQSSSNASPVKSQVTSIDDLRKLRQQITTANNS